MKTIKSKIVTLAFAIGTLAVFTSCNDEEPLVEETSTTETTELEPKELSSRSVGLMGVSRYYLGGANSIHTYRVGNVGVAVGRREGVPFKLGIYNKLITPTPPSGTKQVFFLLSPGNRDFLLTTSVTERNNVIRRGWRNLSEYNFRDREFRSGRIIFNQSAYIHTSGGSGRVKLYRFYGQSNTDHLYTTNYNEGVNAGYIYEGVIGWVHR